MVYIYMHYSVQLSPSNICLLRVFIAWSVLHVRNGIKANWTMNIFLDIFNVDGMFHIITNPHISINIYVDILQSYVLRIVFSVCHISILDMGTFRWPSYNMSLLFIVPCLTEYDMTCFGWIVT